MPRRSILSAAERESLFALTLLRQDQQYLKRSLRSRRKTAGRLTDYRESLLSLQARVNAIALQKPSPWPIGAFTPH
jgi:Tfp pilus assembly protein PilO